MLTQATAIRICALAHQLFGDENNTRYLDAAKAVSDYLQQRLMADNGAFYTSQDADVDTQMTGKVFYNLGAEQRDQLGRVPRVDTNSYTRENALAIGGLLALYDTTADIKLLNVAKRSAEWIVSERALADGEYRHGKTDRGGPFLGDNVAAVEAFSALYASTGERVWLKRASATLTFINSHLRSAEGGFLSHPVPASAVGVFAREVLTVEENVALARAANQVHAYVGQQLFADMANHAMRYLAAPALLENRLFLHGVLLAAEEVGQEPIHITVVGSKSDPAAQALHKAARAYPGVFKPVDWWDRAEGPLPNPDIRYPKLERAAAFACTNNTCSLPVFAHEKVAPMVARLLKPTTGG